MLYNVSSPDQRNLAEMAFDLAYLNPIEGVLADYVYNSLLTGRPYFLQMIEDVEIATHFIRRQISDAPGFAITGTGDAFTFADAANKILPNMKLIPQSNAQMLNWSELVDQKVEVWPVQFLLPRGAYIH